jgi:hypothetical protein
MVLDFIRYRSNKLNSFGFYHPKLITIYYIIIYILWWHTTPFLLVEIWWTQQFLFANPACFSPKTRKARKARALDIWESLKPDVEMEMSRWHGEGLGKILMSMDWSKGNFTEPLHILGKSIVADSCRFSLQPMRWWSKKISYEHRVYRHIYINTLVSW